MIARTYKFSESHSNIIKNNISMYDFIKPLKELIKSEEYKLADSVEVYATREEFKCILIQNGEKTTKSLKYEGFSL